MKKYSKPEIETIVEVVYAPLALSGGGTEDEKPGGDPEPGRDAPWKRGF